MLPASAFHKATKESSGLYYLCKECRRQETRDYYLRKGRLRLREIRNVQRRSSRSLAKSLPSTFLYLKYDQMKKLFMTGQVKSLTVTRPEFIRLGMNSHRFIWLFDNWQKSGLQYKLMPTVDRIDSRGGYDMSNIQFLTMEENRIKETTVDYPNGWKSAL